MTKVVDWFLYDTDLRRERVKDEGIICVSHDHLIFY